MAQSQTIIAKQKVQKTGSTTQIMNFNITINVLLWLLSSSWRKKFGLLVLDLCGAFVSFLLSYWISIRYFSVGDQFLHYSPTFFIFTFFLVLSLYFLNAYKSVEDRRSETELEIVVKGVFLAFFFGFVINFIIFKHLTFSRYVMLLWWLTALFVLPFFRLGVRDVYKALWRKGYLREMVLIIGKGKQAKAIRDHLAIQRHSRFEYVGAITEDNGSSMSLDGIPILGTFNEIEEIVAKNDVHRVFIIPFGLPYEKVSELVRVCRNRNLMVNILSDEFSVVNQQISIDEFTGLLTLEADGIKPFGRGMNRLLKRLIDLIGAFIGLLVLGLLYSLFGLLIKLEDSGPIIYRRRVVGKGGGEFDAFKFRSMKVNADEVLNNNSQLKKAFKENYKLKDDPRLTRVGKFIRKYSLDELPQFVNVLKGQMTLVGPRMIVRSELEKYGQWAERRLTVKPGITGFWQVNGRQNTNYDERVRMDMFYIDYWSIWMDIIILMKTVWKVLKGEGAY